VRSSGLRAGESSVVCSSYLVDKCEAWLEAGLPDGRMFHLAAGAVASTASVAPTSVGKRTLAVRKEAVTIATRKPQGDSCRCERRLLIV